MMLDTEETYEEGTKSFIYSVCLTAVFVKYIGYSSRPDLCLTNTVRKKIYEIKRLGES